MCISSVSRTIRGQDSLPWLPRLLIDSTPSPISPTFPPPHRSFRCQWRIKVSYCVLKTDSPRSHFLFLVCVFLSVCACRLYVKNYSWTDTLAASPTTSRLHTSPNFSDMPATSPDTVSPLISMAMAHQISPLLLKSKTVKGAGVAAGGGGTMVRSGAHHFRSSLMPRDERDATAAEFAMGIYRKFIAREGVFRGFMDFLLFWY